VALNPALVGKTYPPSEPYEVSREKIREFAEAIGDPNPAYRQIEVAKQLGYADVIAPPTFPIALTLRASGVAAFDPEVGIDYSRVVHGDQRFVYSRPVRAGDRLICTVSIESARSIAGSDILGTKADVSTEDGEHVVTAYATIVARSTREG
jgi:acyl dehydratase